MKNFTLISKSFKKGELDKFSLKNKASESSEAASLIKNFIPKKEGILVRRPNTNFVDLLENHSSFRVVPFKYGDTALILLITTQKIYFYQDLQKYVQNNVAVVINSPWDTDEKLEYLNYVTDNFNKCMYFFTVHSVMYKLSVKDSATADSEGKTYKIYELSKLFLNDGPYEDINKDQTITLCPKLSSGNSVPLNSSKPVFSSLDIGRSIRVMYDGVWGWGIISEFINETSVKVDVKQEFPDVVPTMYWRFGILCDASGYPTRGIIANGRLYIANSNFHRNYIWASCYNDFTNFAPTSRYIGNSFIKSDDQDNVTYENAVSSSINDLDYIGCLNICSNYIVAGGKGGIYGFMPADFNAEISPYNYSVKKISSIATNTYNICGSSSNITVLASQNNKDVTVLEYNITAALPYILNNIIENRLVDYDFEVKAIEIVNYNELIIVLLLNNGELKFISVIDDGNSNNYSINSQVFSYNSASASVLSILKIDNLLYLVVKREDITTLEYINLDDFSKITSSQNKIYLDCKMDFSNGVAFNQITLPVNFSQVSVVANGYEYIGELTVENSIITLPDYYTSVSVGFNYTSTYQSLYLEDYGSYSSQGHLKKLNALTIGFINSIGGNLYVNDKLCQNSLSNPYLESSSLFSGERSFVINSAMENKVYLALEQDLPYSFNVSLLELYLTII